MCLLSGHSHITAEAESSIPGNQQVHDACPA